MLFMVTCDGADAVYFVNGESKATAKDRLVSELSKSRPASWKRVEDLSKSRRVRLPLLLVTEEVKELAVGIHSLNE